MPTFEIAIKKIQYGYAITKANNEEEALQNFRNETITEEIMYPEKDIIPIEVREKNNFN